MLWVLLLIALLPGLTEGVRAQQGPGRRCMATENWVPGSPVIWTRLGRDSAGRGRQPAVDSVVTWLAGEFDMLEVPTQGLAHREVRRWRFRLVPTDSAARQRCRLGPCRADILFPVGGARMHPAERFDSLRTAQRRLPSAARLDVTYSTTRGSLMLDADPDVTDGGTLYYVARVTDSTLTGLWSDGAAGYIMQAVTVQGAELEESLKGYFCAWRR